MLSPCVQNLVFLSNGCGANYIQDRQGPSGLRAVQCLESIKESVGVMPLSITLYPYCFLAEPQVLHLSELCLKSASDIGKYCLFGGRGRIIFVGSV